MKYKFLPFFLFLFFSLFGLAQTNQTEKAKQYLDRKHEVFFTFEIKSLSEIKELTKIISIDNVKGNKVFAYANKKEFTKFLQFNYSFEVLQLPSEMLVNPKMFSKFDKNVTDWDSYPTYEAYVAMMYQFETDYPTLCKIHSIGTSNQGRELLFAKISDNVNTDETEPRFMYVSTIHGDETTGFILMLRLIDYLLSNYNTDPFITQLVDNIEIWINPDHNPDGTYAGGNSSVFGATRYNANGIDLNRNFPDFQDGDHPDGNSWQTETIEYMDFADSINFVMSANFHGGAEVFNYPWDTKPQLNPDDTWWQYVARMYADTVHLQNSSYLVDLNNGITNGYAWYEVNGGRQDFMNYFHRCREVTIEISYDKTPAATNLPNFWNYNYRSLLNYIAECLNGVRGIVTDSITGAPLHANVFINNHDAENTDVYSSLPFGNYYRPLYSGTYSITYSCPGYQSKTLSVSVVNHVPTLLDVQLVQIAPEVNFSADITETCTGAIQFIDQTNTAVGSTYLWDFGDGTTSSETNPIHYYTTSGIFNVSLTVTNTIGTDSYSQSNYITVNLPDSPATTSASSCGDASVTLTATGTGVLNWYDQQFGGNLIYTGESFITPILSQTTTYYIENVQEQAELSGGKPDNSGSGGYFNNTSSHYLVFDCYAEVTLKTVKVYANGQGERTISLKDSNGSILESLTVNIPDGESVVTLNFDLPIANGLRLSGSSFPNLYRNDGGTAYPYVIPNILSINYSSAQQNPTNYYYFFYDWKVGNEPCISARVPVTATILPGEPAANFNYTQNQLNVQFNNLSNFGETYFWDFGDGTNSTEENPVHEYANEGIYTVSLTVTNSCGENVYSSDIQLFSGIENVSGFSNLSVFPSPAKNFVTISFDSKSTKSFDIQISDETGKIVFLEKNDTNSGNYKKNINISDFQSGIYILKLNSSFETIVRKLVIY